MAYRRIIIPKGTIISNLTTIIRVPYHLDADAVVVGPKRAIFLDSDILSNALPIKDVPGDFSSDIILNNLEDSIALPIKIVTPSNRFNKYMPIERVQLYEQTPSKIRKRQIPYDNRSTPKITTYSTINSNLLTDVNTKYEESALNYPFFSSEVEETYYDDENQSLNQTANTYPYSPYGNVSRTSDEGYLNVERHENTKAPNKIQKSYSDYSRDNHPRINSINSKFIRFGSIPPNRSYTTYHAYDKSPYSNSNFDTKRQSPEFYFPDTQNKTEIQAYDNDNLYHNFPDKSSTYVTISKRDFTQMFPEITQNNRYLTCIYEEETDEYLEEDEQNKDGKIKSNQPINNPIRETSLIVNSSGEDSQTELVALPNVPSSNI